MSQFNLMDLCRLCLDKDRVSIPIFEGEGVVKKLYMKIGACLPVKVSESDRLPKKICDDCIYKVELVYSFWNTTANAEKQLLALLGEAELEPQVPLSNNSVKTENDVLVRGGMEESISSSKSHPNEVDITNTLSNSTGGPLSMSGPLSAPVGMSNSTVNRLSNEMSNQSREDESDEEDSDDEGPYSDEEDDPAAVGEGETSYNTMEPTFVSVGQMGDEAGPSGLQQEMETENMDGDEMPAESGAAQPDESQRSEPASSATLSSRLCEFCGAEHSDSITHSFLCTICNLNFTNRSALNRHKGVHKSPCPLTCQQCKASFTFPYQLKKHSLTHTGLKPHLCPICNTSFSTRDGVNSHMIRRHSTDRPFVCDICKKAFKLRADLNIHRKTHSNERTHACDVCGRAFIQKSALVSHQSRHRKDYKYFCGVCAKGFYVLQEWHSHEMTHGGVRPFECGTCGRSYNRKTSLVAHEKSHLPGYKPRAPKHECETCGKLCHSRVALNLHGRAHSGVSLYTCSLCGKSLGSKSSLETHLRTHTGEKPHGCEVCGKTFSSKKNLVIHIRVHTGEKRYCCRDCGRKFTQRSSLTQHERYSCTVRSCSECQTEFASRSELAVHRQTSRHGVREVSVPPVSNLAEQASQANQLVQVVQMYLVPTEVSVQDTGTSFRPRKRKLRSNRRRTVTEVPVAANTANIDIPASNFTENPAFKIVCVDDNVLPVDASAQPAQLNPVDPLCVDNVDVKPERDPLEVSPNTSTVSHFVESDRLSYVETLAQQPPEDISLPPLIISRILTPSDTSQQPVSENDPLQLNDIKVDLERFERDKDAQPSLATLEHVEETRGDAFAGEAVNEPDVPSQEIFPFYTLLVTSEIPSGSDSAHNSTIVPSEGQQGAVPLSLSMQAMQKCPLCCRLITAADFLEHVKSHELSTAVQTSTTQRSVTANSALKTFACTKCPFKASVITDLSKHVKEHEIEESNMKKMQQQTSTNRGQHTSARSPISSVPYASSGVSTGARVPLLITLGDDTEPNARPSSGSFLSTSSPAILIQASVSPANTSPFNIDPVLSSQVATSQTQGQSISSDGPRQEDDEILILSDSPIQGNIPSVSTAPKRPAAGQSADSISPSPVSIAECLTNATSTPNLPSSASFQIPVNGEESSLYSVQQSRGTHQRQSSDSYLTTLRTMCESLGFEHSTNTYRLPSHESAAVLVSCSSSTEHLPTTTQQPVGAQPSDKSSKKLSEQRPLTDLYIQTDILVAPDGAIQEIHTLRRRDSARVSVGAKPPQRLPRTLPTGRFEQSGLSQRVSNDSVEEVLPTRCSPSPSPQLAVTAPRELSVIQQSPRNASVIHPPIFLTQSAPVNLVAYQSVHLSGEVASNEATDLTSISSQLHPSAEESAEPRLLHHTPSNKLPRSADSLSGQSTIQSRASSLSEQQAANESIQAFDNMSNLSHLKSRPSVPPNMSINDVLSPNLNDVRSVSSGQIPSSVLLKPPGPPTSCNQSQLSISSRIDRLIEANDRVLQSTPTAKTDHPFHVPSLKAAETDSSIINSRNTRPIGQSTKSTESPNHSQVVNLNPADKTPSTVCGSSGSIASTSRSAMSIPPFSCDSVSSGNMLRADSGPQNPNENGAISIAGPVNNVVLDNTIRTTYELRRKSLKTRTRSEKAYSSSESDSSAVSDPDYLPPGQFNSDDSDNPDDPSPVPRAFSENINPIPSVVSKTAAKTGVTKDVMITKIISSVSEACSTSSSSIFGSNTFACARSYANEKHNKPSDSLQSQTSHRERREDHSLSLVNLLRSSARVQVPTLPTAPKPLSSQSRVTSINQLPQIFSSECSRNATRAPILPSSSSSESISNPSFNAILDTSTFTEAHLLMLANATKNTSVIPKTSHITSPVATTSVEARHNSTDAISNFSTGTNIDSTAKSRANDKNPVLDTNKSIKSAVEVSLRGSENVDLEISERTNTAGEVGCRNSNPATFEVENLNSSSKETPFGCEEVSQNISQAMESTSSTGTNCVQDTSLSTFAINSAKESHLERNRILESTWRGKSNISTSEGVLSGNAPCAYVATGNTLPCDDPAVANGHAQRPTQSLSEVIDVASDDDSSAVDDSDPKTRRKGSLSDGSSSESGHSTMVDPDYVPPPRDRLPLKTPDEVLDAIPYYEHWIRSKFVHEDSDIDTPRPDNDCRVCLRVFPSHEMLKEHRTERYSDLQCCKCSFRASNVTNMKRHTAKHTKPKPYKCDECGQTFRKRGAYVRHFLGHRGDFYFKCNICDQGFNEYTPYEGHINRHLNKTPYKCLKCNLAFTAKALLSCHKKRTHNREAFTECTVCKKVILKYWFAGHMKRHEQKNDRKFLCDQCGRSFISKLSLARHNLQHTGERPHMCKYCGATFKVSGALKQHERKHTGERPFKCKECGKTFAFNTPYTYHLRIHTGERPYKCEYCGMTFAQPSPYAVHKRLHTGERPYKCKICDEAFASHAAVRNHMQTHANSGKVQKRKTSQGKKPKPKKPRKRRSAPVGEDSSSSGSEKESTGVPVQPRRRSGRQTKCTKSLVEEKGSDSGEEESDSGEEESDSAKEKEKNSGEDQQKISS